MAGLVRGMEVRQARDSMVSLHTFADGSIWLLLHPLDVQSPQEFCCLLGHESVP